MRHPHPDVRRRALEVAAQRSPQLAERFGRLGLRDKEPALRRAAIDALAASRRREALPDLAALLQTGAADERVHAARALGRLGIAEAAAPLGKAVQKLGLLKRSRTPVELAAVEALADVPGEAALGLLRQLGEDGDRELAARARRALAQRTAPAS